MVAWLTNNPCSSLYSRPFSTFDLPFLTDGYSFRRPRHMLPTHTYINIARRPLSAIGNTLRDIPRRSPLVTITLSLGSLGARCTDIALAPAIMPMDLSVVPP